MASLPSCEGLAFRVFPQARRLKNALWWRNVRIIAMVIGIISVRLQPWILGFGVQVPTSAAGHGLAKCRMLFPVFFYGVVPAQMLCVIIGMVSCGGVTFPSCRGS